MALINQDLFPSFGCIVDLEKKMHYVRKVKENVAVDRSAIIFTTITVLPNIKLFPYSPWLKALQNILSKTALAFWEFTI